VHDDFFEVSVAIRLDRDQVVARLRGAVLPGLNLQQKIFAHR